MKYLSRIQSGLEAPQALEALFAEATKEHGVAEFGDDIETAYAAAPDQLLLSAWHFRLQPALHEADGRRPVNWTLALALSVLTGLVLWWLSGSLFVFHSSTGRAEPFLVVFVSPVIALATLAYVAASRGRSYGLPAVLGAALAVVTAF
ncbi:MAG: hypothetical protein ACYC7F_07990, partial [Gemmatimonadaceae bacterium]